MLIVAHKLLAEMSLLTRFPQRNIAARLLPLSNIFPSANRNFAAQAEEVDASDETFTVTVHGFKVSLTELKFYRLTAWRKD